MRVLQISSLHNQTPPSGYGGTERFVDALTTSLITKDIKVDVIAKRSPRDTTYNVIEADYSNLQNVLLDSLKTTKYDLIHFHLKDKDLFSSIHTFELPIVVTMHNNIRKNSSWIDIIADSPNNFHFTVISENLKTRVEKAFKENSLKLQKNIKVTGFGMDFEQYLQFYKPETNRDHYIYIGNIARYKGVSDIVKYFSSIDKKLIIVGPCNDPNEKHYFQEVMQIVNSNENISYHGETKSEEEKIRLLNSSKALIIATGLDAKEIDCHEAFGLVMLEANSLGTPVLGYDKGNISEYVREGQNGFKFKEVDELTHLINKIEKNYLADTCIDIAKQYNIDKIADNHINLYTKITI